MRNGSRKLAVWFIGLSCLVILISAGMTSVINDRVTPALAALAGTALGYLAGLLVTDDRE